MHLLKIQECNLIYTMACSEHVQHSPESHEQNSFRYLMIMIETP